MKKLLCVLLAAVMILTLFSGCGKTGEDAAIGADLVPTMFQDITGIPQDQIVMTVGNIQVPAELYFYWVCYVCSSLEYNILNEYNSYGMYGSCIDRDTMTINWDGQYAGLPLMDYALSQAEETIKYYMSIEELAAEKGAGLSEENKADLDSTFRAAVKEMGGEAEFLSYLKMLGISRENFDRISAVTYLYDNLLTLVYQEGSELYLAEEDYNLYGTYADHILIATQNMQSGEQLRPEEAVTKYQEAEELVAQIRAAEDPASMFAQLANEHSDDPGRQDNPTGYVYTAGTMVPEFEATASSLQVGEISDPIQSDYGWHIILRRDLVEYIRKDAAKKEEIARSYLDGLLVRKRSASAVVYDEVLDSMDWSSFYDSYIQEVEKISAAANNAA